MSESSAQPIAPLEPKYVIDIVNLSKKFKRGKKGAGYTTLKTGLLNLFRNTNTKNNSNAEKNEDDKKSHVTVAVEDLTLRIRKGSAVGIIGRNGAGKSTLLKLISGIYKPDTGTIKVEGRVSALIELGAGFHPDFTGRENIQLAGAMHGLNKKEILSKFDEIVAFAELEDVIDDPVRTYSSGMYMRLGFSIAIHTDPDLLIVDEVLAVGDAAFVTKCKEKILEMFKAGKTLLFVSHDLDTVSRWCNEVLWIHKGVVMDRGEPRRVIDHYYEFLEKEEEKELQKKLATSEKIVEILEDASAHSDSVKSNSTKLEDSVSEEGEAKRWGSHEIVITECVIKDGIESSGISKQLFHPDDSLEVEFKYKVNESRKDVVFGIGIHKNDGTLILGTNTDIDKKVIEIREEGEGTVRFLIKRLSLQEGKYSIDLAIHAKDGYPFDYIRGIADFVVRNNLKQVGVVLPEYEWK